MHQCFILWFFFVCAFIDHNMSFILNNLWSPYNFILTLLAQKFHKKTKHCSRIMTRHFNGPPTKIEGFLSSFFLIKSFVRWLKCNLSHANVHRNVNMSCHKNYRVDGRLIDGFHTNLNFNWTAPLNAVFWLQNKGGFAEILIYYVLLRGGFMTVFRGLSKKLFQQQLIIETETCLNKMINWRKGNF